MEKDKTNGKFTKNLNEAEKVNNDGSRSLDGNVYLKILVNIIILVVAILLLIYVLPKVLNFFLPFIIGWIIAAIANPLVKFIEKHVGILRKHSSAFVIIFVIGIVVLAIYGVITFLINRTSVFLNDVPNIVSIVTDTLDRVGENLSGILGGLPSDVQRSINQFIVNIQESISSVIGSEQVSDATISFARNIGDYILGIFIVFISAYFFIKDREDLIAKARELTPDSVLEKYDMIVYYFKHAVGGYFKAQLKIMLILIAIMYIGFKVIGTRYALLIAIITGIVDVLPVFGTGFILWPWALIELILGNYFEALMLLIIYLGCQLIKNIIQPKMVGDSVGLNTLATLFFMYIGYKFAGILGMILAIPIGLVLVNLYRVGMFDNIIRGIKILITDINQFRRFWDLITFTNQLVNFLKTTTLIVVVFCHNIICLLLLNVIFFF